MTFIKWNRKFSSFAVKQTWTKRPYRFPLLKGKWVELLSCRHGCALFVQLSFFDHAHGLNVSDLNARTRPRLKSQHRTWRSGFGSRWYCSIKLFRHLSWHNSMDLAAVTFISPKGGLSKPHFWKLWLKKINVLRGYFFEISGVLRYFPK